MQAIAHARFEGGKGGVARAVPRIVGAGERKERICSIGKQRSVRAIGIELHEMEDDEFDKNLVDVTYVEDRDLEAEGYTVEGEEPAFDDDMADEDDGAFEDEDSFDLFEGLDE